MQLKLTNLDSLVHELKARKLENVRSSILQKQTITADQITHITASIMLSAWDPKQGLLIVLEFDIWSEMAVNLQDKKKIGDFAATEEKQLKEIEEKFKKEKISILDGYYVM